MSREKEPTVAWISKHNGAWFIDFDTGHDTSQEAAPKDLYNCASSLTAAKRVARRMAEELNFIGPFHWTWEDYHWVLSGYSDELDPADYDYEMESNSHWSAGSLA